MKPTHRVHVLYSGRVQGVGFRYTAVGIARSAGVAGWVRNLSDGRVEVCAEGTEKTLEGFLGRLKTEFSGHIRGIEMSWPGATGEFRGFEIII